MADDQTEFLELYDDDLGAVLRSNHRTFGRNLRLWLNNMDEHPIGAAVVRSLVSQVDFGTWFSDQKKVAAVSQHIVDLEWPQQSEGDLGMRIALLQAFAEKKEDPLEFVEQFVSGNTSFDDDIADLNSDIVEGTGRDLRRLLRKEFQRAERGETVMASDRLVDLKHNSQSYQDLVDTTNELRSALKESNEPLEPQEKAQRLAELGAAIELIKAERVRGNALWETLGKPVKWILKTSANVVVTRIANKLWDIFWGYWSS